MAIENFNEIQQYFEANKENEEVKGYLNGFKQEPSLDIFKSKIESDETFKSYINAVKDSHFSKGLETWKSNNLSKLVDAEMLKKNPSLTPEQLEMQNLKTEIENIKKEKSKAEMSSKYKDVLAEKKIPSKMVDFLLAGDDEVTNANISLFEESMKAYIEEAIKTKFGNNVHIPQNPTNTQNTLISQSEWDSKKNDLDWYSKNKTAIFESKKQGLIK